MSFIDFINELGFYTTKQYQAEYQAGYNAGRTAQNATPVVSSSNTNTTTTPVQTATPTPVVSNPVVPVNPDANPFVGPSLYVDPNSSAAQWIAANPLSPDVPMIHKIASEPQSFWLNYDASQSSEQNQTNVSNQVKSILQAAGNQLVTFVVYGIPNRDNGGQSAGGAPDNATYEAWVGAIEAGVIAAGNPNVVFIVEPDAVAFAWSNQNYSNLSAIQIAVSILTKLANRFVYIDAAMWDSTGQTMIKALQFLLTQDKMTNVRGWALNTAGYNGPDLCNQFGQTIVAAVGGHYIYDSSRNGNPTAPAGEWENVQNMALGARPLSQDPTTTFDGNLWVKRPGESDGADNGAPAAGQFYEQYALGLAQRANY
jgi:endoglucanase